MSSASANSSTTSKEVKQKTTKLRVVGGPLQVVEKNKEYSIEMNPEYIIDFSTPMMELSKSVGTFTKVTDKNGKIIERVDDKTGVKYKVMENDTIKAVRKTSKKQRDDK